MQRLTRQVLQHANGLPVSIERTAPLDPPELPPAETVVQHLQRLLHLLMDNPLVNPPVVGRRGGAKAAAAQLQRLLGEEAPIGAPLLRRPAQQLLLQLAELQARLRGETDTHPPPLFVRASRAALPPSGHSVLPASPTLPATPPSGHRAPPASPTCLDSVPAAVVLSGVTPTSVPGASVLPTDTCVLPTDTCVPPTDTKRSKPMLVGHLPPQECSNGCAKPSGNVQAVPATMEPAAACLDNLMTDTHTDVVVHANDEPARLPDHGWKEVCCW